MTVSFFLTNQPTHTHTRNIHLTKSSYFPGRRSRTPTQPLHHQFLLILLLLVQHNDNTSTTSFLLRRLRPLQRPRSLQPPVGHHRSQLRHPKLRSLELGLRRRRLQIHASGSAAAACGREPDRVECQTTVESDVFGGEEECRTRGGKDDEMSSDERWFQLTSAVRRNCFVFGFWTNEHIRR